MAAHAPCMAGGGGVFAYRVTVHHQSVASPAGSTPQVAVMAEIWDSGWVWQQVNTPVCGLAEYEGEPRNAPSKLANSC